MNVLKILALLCFGALLASCQGGASGISVGEISPQVSSASSDFIPAGYTLRWADEFDGSSLNPAYWSAEVGDGSLYGIPGWGNNEQEYYQSENATVSGGLLHLTAKKESKVSGELTYPYTSARLKTVGKISMTYGFVEARIKLPALTGMWPAFWLLPESTYQNKGWPTSGELDIMENRGREERLVTATVHSATSAYSDLLHSNSITLSSPVDQFHVYGMEWLPEVVKFFADGSLYGAVSREMWTGDCPLYEGGPAPFNQPFYILLNLAVGGNFDGGKLPPSDFAKAEMSVDYVRIFQNNEKSSAKRT
jgi:beta-glucanase (GH16 family)